MAEFHSIGGLTDDLDQLAPGHKQITNFVNYDVIKNT